MGNENNNGTKRSLEQVLAAIHESGGIKRTIATRLQVSRPTVDSYLRRWASARQLYEEETEIIIDLAESIVKLNLELRHKEQLEEQKPVDTSDARWVLTMKGGNRGYVQHRRQEITGAGGEPLTIILAWEDTDADDAG